MSCSSCSNSVNGTPAGCKNNGNCGNGGCSKLSVFNWLGNMNLPSNIAPFPAVEIRFKNGRKGFFKNELNVSLYEGEVVVVDAEKGYDVGIISLSGELVRLQMQKKNMLLQTKDLSKVLRKADQKEIEKWQEGQAKEADAIHKSRAIASGLGLQMKITDVEYQGDLSKAVFYYTAEERIDFRELVRKLADQFKIRIEMKQIGMRQEAGRIGGIGSCGRELCCSTWLTDFRSVSTSAARYQQLSLNPAKLAGQCGKLKCCLNYELDVYLDELKKFPDTKKQLKTKKGNAFFQKMDIFANKMWYSYKDEPFEMIELSLDRVKEIIAKNKAEEKVDDLKSYQDFKKEPKAEYANVVGQDDLNRFDHKNKGKGNRKKRNKKRRSGKNKGTQQQNRQK